MKRLMRLRFAFLVSFLIIVLLGVSSCAHTQEQTPPTFNCSASINDGAGVLTNGQKEALLILIDAMQKKLSATGKVVTVRNGGSAGSLEGYLARVVTSCPDWQDTPSKIRRDFIVVAVSVNAVPPNKVGVFRGSNFTDALPDSLTQRIQSEEMAPLTRQGQFGDAIVRAFSAVMSSVNDYGTVRQSPTRVQSSVIPVTQNTVEQSQTPIDFIDIVLALAFVFTVIVLIVAGFALWEAATNRSSTKRIQEQRRLQLLQDCQDLREQVIREYGTNDTSAETAAAYLALNLSTPISETASIAELSEKKKRMIHFLKKIGVEPVVGNDVENASSRILPQDTPHTPPPPPSLVNAKAPYPFTPPPPPTVHHARSRSTKTGTAYGGPGIIVINNADYGEPRREDPYHDTNIGGRASADTNSGVNIGGNASNDSVPINIGGSESRDDSTSAVDIGGSETPATSTPEVDLGGSPTSDEPSWDSGNSDPIPDTGSFDTGSVEIGGYSSDG